MWQYNELYHHGIQGQKWGVRRYQNPDGTLTEEGLRRYRNSGSYSNYKKESKALKKEYRDKLVSEGTKKKVAKSIAKEKAINDLVEKYGRTTVTGWENRNQFEKRVIAGAIIGNVPIAAVAGIITVSQQKRLAQTAGTPYYLYGTSDAAFRYMNDRLAAG